MISQFPYKSYKDVNDCAFPRTVFGQMLLIIQETIISYGIIWNVLEHSDLERLFILFLFLLYDHFVFQKHLGYPFVPLEGAVVQPDVLRSGHRVLQQEGQSVFGLEIR